MPLDVADLTIEARGRRVRAGATELRVTAREFDVLLFLVQREGQVLSKKAILDGVWSDDFDGDPNIVEVYIARLRRKLAEVSSAVAIETVRGSGYRLAAS